jgi:hypothetical protein
MTLVLRPVDLHWLDRTNDDPSDLCAHGSLEFRIGGDDLAEGAAGEEWTVSAAALYLLRTLSIPHTKESPVGDHLFPCCGFAMYDVAGEEDVEVCGCPNGLDFQILHSADGSGVVVRSEDGREWAVAREDWARAVFGFVDTVSTFYAMSPERQPSTEDAPGFRKFQAEWARRRGKPLGLVEEEE